MGFVLNQMGGSWEGEVRGRTVMRGFYDLDMHTEAIDGIFTLNTPFS